MEQLNLFGESSPPAIWEEPLLLTEEGKLTVFHSTFFTDNFLALIIKAAEPFSLSEPPPYYPQGFYCHPSEKGWFRNRIHVWDLRTYIEWNRPQGICLVRCDDVLEEVIKECKKRQKFINLFVYDPMQSTFTKFNLGE